MIEEFREDHRKVRDLLLDLSESIRAKNISRARAILGELDSLLGPHFRFEEEELYPTLKRFLGEYVDDLLEEHDEAIKAARDILEVIKSNKLDDSKAEEYSRKARSLLVHVTNCDGLAILAERLEPEELLRLDQKLKEIRSESIPLLEWAETLRKAGGIV